MFFCYTFVWVTDLVNKAILQNEEQNFAPHISIQKAGHRSSRDPCLEAPGNYRAR